jgi:hypothetical protein
MALLVILILYLGIEVMSAVGSITISKKLFSAKTEQIFFGFLLTPIAALYLTFTAYFGSIAAWRLEAITVVIFAVLGTLGMRVPVVLLVGYATHGVWDLLHELHINAVVGVYGTGRLSAIPLAYGVFCATYDWCMTGYFYTRRKQWNAAWREGLH